MGYQTPGERASLRIPLTRLIIGVEAGMRSVRGFEAIFALLALSPAWLGAQAETSRLAGRVLSTDGAAVAGARVSVGWSLPPIRSDSAGQFLVEAAPSGRVRLQVRVLGFSPLDTTLTLQAGENHAVTFRMTRSVQQLEPVITEAVLPYGKPLRYQHTGRFDDFYERRAKRPGTFFTREDIENSNRNTAMELMSTAPGVRLNWRNGSAVVRVARCTATSIYGAPRDRGDTDHSWLMVVIDGQRIQAGAIEFLANLKSNEIETMEVYRGPSQLPMEAVGDACAAVFITTRYTTGSVLTK